jgi:two-component system, NarL family, invasion response regulator UvrY
MDSLTQSPAILIVDHHSIVVAGIRMMLEINIPNAKIDQACSGNMLHEKLKTQKYDLVTLDINMPDTDTHNLIHLILTKYPDLKILIFSMSPEELCAIRFLKQGVYGFLSKDAPKENLLEAINVILRGEHYFSPKTIQLLSASLRKGGEKINLFDSLSSREFEVMSHLVSERSLKQISEIVSIHSSTLGTQKNKIFTKLSVTNRLELKDLALSYNIRPLL